MKTRTLTPEELADAMRNYPRPMHSRPVFAMAVAAVMFGAALGALITFDPVSKIAACAVEIAE